MTAHTTPSRREPLDLDPAATLAAIARFLRAQMARPPRRTGYVVGVSGGVDSAVAAALCVQAVGAARVHAVLLPERESQPEGIAAAREVVQFLGLASEQIDLTSPLELLDVYRGREAVVRELFGTFEPGSTYRLVLPGDLDDSDALNVYRVEMVTPKGERMVRRPDLVSLRRLQALTNVKQRLRMTVLYREAEARGALVCGTTNRTELALGFFVGHGDGGVDVEPLAGLYKTQVYALARRIGLPSVVVERVPSPDTWSAPVSDREFYLRLDYARLDAVLARLELGEAVASISADTSLDAGLVERIQREIQRRREASQRLRELPPAGPDGSPGRTEQR